jgi:hypothetical protein
MRESIRANSASYAERRCDQCTAADRAHSSPVLSKNPQVIVRNRRQSHLADSGCKAHILLSLRDVVGRRRSWAAIAIQVGTYVSGPIQELYCDFNTVVRKGQRCAKIDPRPYQTHRRSGPGQSLQRQGAAHQRRDQSHVHEADLRANDRASLQGATIPRARPRVSIRSRHFGMNEGSSRLSAPRRLQCD